MMLEFVAYLYTMVIFAGYVLLNEDNSFDWAEITFASYVCVSFSACFATVRFRLRQRGDQLMLFFSRSVVGAGVHLACRRHLCRPFRVGDIAMASPPFVWNGSHRCSISSSS